MSFFWEFYSLVDVDRNFNAIIFTLWVGDLDFPRCLLCWGWICNSLSEHSLMNVSGVYSFSSTDKKYKSGQHDVWWAFCSGNMELGLLRWQKAGVEAAETQLGGYLEEWRSRGLEIRKWPALCGVFFIWHAPFGFCWVSLVVKINPSETYLKIT